MCDVKNGKVVVRGHKENEFPLWLRQQGLCANVKLTVLSNNKNYVLFELDNAKCAIDKNSASCILVEKTND